MFEKEWIKKRLPLYMDVPMSEMARQIDIDYGTLNRFITTDKAVKVLSLAKIYRWLRTKMLQAGDNPDGE